MRRHLLLPLLFVATPAFAATYQVGPTRTYATLNQLFAAVNLGGGDIVEVDGNVTYAGGVIVPAADGGSSGNPVVIRGIRVNGQRPRIDGSTNTVEFRQSNYVVFEGFEVTGGSSRCILQGAHEVTVRTSSPVRSRWNIPRSTTPAPAPRSTRCISRATRSPGPARCSACATTTSTTATAAIC
jgi:hypothetical protein